jgi:hypothetical protein
MTPISRTFANLILVLNLLISAGTSAHPLVLKLILVPFLVISLTSLGVP